MNYADIAIIVILVISMILGFVKGFWRSFSKVITLAASLALGFLLADKLAPIIFKGDMLNAVNGLVGNLIVQNEVSSGTLVMFNNEFYVAVPSGDNLLLENALKQMLIPTFLQAPIIGSAAGLSAEALAQGVTVGSLVSSAYTHILTLVLAGGIIFLAALIVLGVIARLIYNLIYGRDFHRAIDRIMGGVFRIVTGLLLVIIILHVVTMMSGLSFMTPVIDVINEGKISGPLYEANLLNKIFYGDGMSKLIDTFKNVILTVAPEEAPVASMIATIL